MPQEVKRIQVLQEWKERKKACRDIGDLLREGMEVSAKEVFSRLGIVVDEEVGASIFEENWK